MKKLVFIIAVLGISACEKANVTETKEVQVVQKTELEVALGNLGIFKPLRDTFARPDQTKAQEDLGRMLYYEHRISKNQDLSCNSCHGLDTYGVDLQPTSPGHKGVRGNRNSPTVYNAAGHVAQFWDGREPDVEAQAKGPVLNPVEMAMPDPEHVVAVLNSMPGYVEAFKTAFPTDESPVTYDNFGLAVGAFERNLTTPSRWDSFLKGDHSALSQTELKGFNTFTALGCQACHNGEMLGGMSYQKIGTTKPWPNLEDRGRKDVTKNDADDLFFKTPSLRNVAKTAPYFHDGSVPDLETAVRMMAIHQLAKELSDEEVKDIVAWLNTLTGDIDLEYIAKPVLPESTPNTPLPDPS